MAELLVKAKAHWMDSLPQSEIDKMDEDKLRSFNGRSQIGDVIVVKPDGWKWGKEECLPNFVVVKIPDLKIEDAEKYQESIYEEYFDDLQQETDYRLIKRRKYQIPQNTVDAAKQQSKTIIEINQIQKDAFVSDIIQKVN